MDSNITKLINPKSIAIVGASADPQKIGYQMLSNLIESGYLGEVFPVNPKGGEILGKKVFSSLSEISQDIDLVAIVVPRQFVLGVVEECAQIKVSAIEIISAGFAESDDEGKKLQTEIVEICQKNNITLLGPNCLGFINNAAKINISFSKGTPAQGPLSFLSQSGALISSVIDWSKTSGIGFDKIFSLGNKAILGENEILKLLYEDADTNVVLGYFENFEISNVMTEILVENAKKKPTIFLIGGKSEGGASAAKSHTGSIVTSYLTLKTYFAELGIILAENVEDLFLYAWLFSKVQNVAGNRVAVVSNAGGPAVITTDAILQNNLELAKLSETTKQSILSEQPDAIVHNPVDLLGDATADQYLSALNIISQDENVDAIMVVTTPQSNTNIEEIAQKIASVKSPKPIFTSFIGGNSSKIANEIFANSSVLNFDYPEDAIRSIGILFGFSNKEIEHVGVANKGSKIFDVNTKNQILLEYDLPIVEYVKVESDTDLPNALTKTGFPAVVKTAKTDVVHKMDGGGVALNLVDENTVKQAIEKIGYPIIIGKMIKTKHEIFVGLKKDNFGNIITAFGTGGIYAELYEDMSYRINLDNLESAKKMILETKMGQILNGARGQNVYNLDKLAETMLSANRLVADFDDIVEIDFNPIIATENDYFIVDARIVNKRSS